MRKISIILFILILAIVGGFFIVRKKNQPAKNSNAGIQIEIPATANPAEKSEMAIDSPASEKNEAGSIQKNNPEQDLKNIPKLPDKILIDVPFTSQAPLSKWDLYHEEACEEASLLMVKYFLDGKTLTPKIAEQEIQSMIAFEIKKYGNYKDSTAEEIAKLAKDFYGIDSLKIIYDFKKEDIKIYLAKNKPIIVPAAGRLLGNPNFTAPGPLYHNLVLIGYDKDTVVTNDPGTRKGKGYTYDIDTLYAAIHDFPGKPENILKGRKAMLVLE